VTDISLSLPHSLLSLNAAATHQFALLSTNTFPHSLCSAFPYLSPTDS